MVKPRNELQNFAEQPPFVHPDSILKAKNDYEILGFKTDTKPEFKLAKCILLLKTYSPDIVINKGVLVEYGISETDPILTGVREKLLTTFLKLKLYLKQVEIGIDLTSNTPKVEFEPIEYFSKLAINQFIRAQFLPYLERKNKFLNLVTLLKEPLALACSSYFYFHNIISERNDIVSLSSPTELSKIEKLVLNSYPENSIKRLKTELKMDLNFDEFRMEFLKFLDQNQSYRQKLLSLLLSQFNSETTRSLIEIGFKDWSSHYIFIERNFPYIEIRTRLSQAVNSEDFNF